MGVQIIEAPMYLLFRIVPGDINVIQKFTNVTIIYDKRFKEALYFRIIFNLSFQLICIH